MHRPANPALRPAVAIILLIANLVKASPRSLVKICGASAPARAANV